MTPRPDETDVASVLCRLELEQLSGARFGIAEVPEDGAAYFKLLEAQYGPEIDRLKRERQIHIQCIAKLQGKVCALEGELSNLNFYCQRLAKRAAARPGAIAKLRMLWQRTRFNRLLGFTIVVLVLLAWRLLPK
jgi:hypothetical protein